MGRSDSVFLLMAIHIKKTQETIARVPALQTFTILNLVDVRLSGKRIRASSGALYIHVDDVIGCHTDGALVDLAI